MKNFPLRGTLVKELKREGEIRQIVHGNYRILYNCDEPVVQVLSIFQTRRDVKKAWKESRS